MAKFNAEINSDISIARLGKPSGFAPLGIDNKVPITHLPTSIVGGLKLQGGYDASSNIPDLTNIAQQVDGALYIVTTEGSQNIGNGLELFSVGDTIFYSSVDSRWYSLQGTVLAIEVAYDNSDTLIQATNVQDAITEVVNNTGAGFVDTPDGDYVSGKNFTLSTAGNNLIAGRDISADSEDTVLFGRDLNIGGKNSVFTGWGITSSNIVYGLGANHTLTGSQVIAIGESAVLEGNNSIAIGITPTANSDNSIAIGFNSNVSLSANDGVAIGTAAEVTAIGAVQLSTGINTVSDTLQFKNNRIANDEGLYTSHIGVNYDPSNIDNVTSHLAAIDTALGNVGGEPHVDINSNGGNASALGFDAISIGRSSTASGASSTRIGFSGSSIGTRSISIGNSSNSDGINSTSIGASANSSANSAISIGNSSTASGIFSVAIGRTANATAFDSIQLGQGINSTSNTIQYKLVSIANNRVVTPLQLGLESVSTIDAVNGQIALVDVSGNIATVNPPPFPQPLDIFGVSDTRSNSSVNNITIDFVAAGNNLNGSLQNYLLNADAGYVEFIYINTSIGWIAK